MVQRILERGEIETLAQRSIPRIRLPDRERVFAARARRLRQLAEGHPLAAYLRLMAVLADAQQSALAGLDLALPGAAQVERAHAHGMPPIAAASWMRDPRWHDMLERIVAAIAADEDLPDVAAALCARLHEASHAWRDAQADAILALRHEAIDIATAPFLMAALQVYWTVLTAAFDSERVHALDVPGVCPLCGSLPVASIVCTQQPYQGYRYLQCSLCAAEWHMVRVQCSQCGATGKDIGYHSLSSSEGGGDAAEAAATAVRAESCDACRCYRKILYQEHAADVEPVADDLASLALDLLLGEQGYARASGNPLLWQAPES